MTGNRKFLSSEKEILERIQVSHKLLPHSKDITIYCFIIFYNFYSQINNRKEVYFSSNEYIFYSLDVDWINFVTNLTKSTAFYNPLKFVNKNYDQDLNS